MIKREKTAKGHIFFKVTREQMINDIKGMGLCDNCNKPMQNGFLIPVLNSILCDSCFPSWCERATYYKEDEPYEIKKADYYESLLAK